MAEPSPPDSSGQDTHGPPPDSQGNIASGHLVGGRAKTKGHDPKAHPHDEDKTRPAEELTHLREEVKQAKDQYLRTLAEFDNTRKRLDREKDEFAKFAAESMVRSLLPILDSLDQALVAVDKQSDPQAVIKGIHLIYRQLLGLLEKEGVKRIPTVGEPFDPHLHEAVGHTEVDGKPDDTIAEEVQVGYTMHGKVIRPAIVKVAKKTADSTQQTAHSKEQNDTHDK